MYLLLLVKCPLDPDCPVVVSREEWGARYPREVANTPDRLPYMIIHHSEGPECFSQTECSQVLRDMQDQNMDSEGKSDIEFNFLISSDGTIYEGTGWNIAGSHTEGSNDVSYGICFLGDYGSHVPEPDSANAFLRLEEVRNEA